jgi:hypothetical protein
VGQRACGRRRGKATFDCSFRAGLKPPRNIGRVVEDGEDRGRPIIGDPIAARLEPSEAACGEGGVETRRG